MIEDYNKRGEIILSVIMITVPERELEFKKLRKKLSDQIDYCEKVHPTLGRVQIVEVLTEKFINGGFSIGKKRGLGLRKSKGKYVCWLDDDDDIAPNYVETLLRLAIADADVLVFNNISRFEDFWAIVQMNLDFLVDEQISPGIVHRRPYHVCGWKRELVQDCVFPDANVDEDTGFIAQALKVCKTQSKTEAVLHEYRRVTKSLALETL